MFAVFRDDLIKNPVSLGNGLGGAKVSKMHLKFDEAIRLQGTAASNLACSIAAERQRTAPFEHDFCALLCQVPPISLAHVSHSEPVYRSEWVLLLTANSYKLYPFLGRDQFPASWSDVQRVRLSRNSCMIKVESL